MFVITIIALVISGICIIAVSAIGIECYNKNKKYKDSKKTNFNFIVFILVCGVLILLAGLGFLGFEIFTYTPAGRAFRWKDQVESKSIKRLKEMGAKFGQFGQFVNKDIIKQPGQIYSQSTQLSGV